MNDDEGEGFLQRWSRLKRAGSEERSDPAGEAPLEPEGDEDPVAEPFDPATLPPIATLTADSDYTAFLARGVPEELQRLALRKAWASDPKIAAFRGFAEYDWDCNAPGYGQLLACDDVKRLCNALLGDPEADRDDPAATPEAPASEPEPAADLVAEREYEAGDMPPGA
jgi:hypothetical protein